MANSRNKDYKIKKGEIQQALAHRKANYEYMANHPEESKKINPIWFYDKPYYFKRKERLEKKEGDDNKRRN